jgi:general L-amino acid transport system substrate-binding protein
MLGLVALAGMMAHAAVAQPQTRSPTLEAVRARGQIVCGMQGDNPPFSYPDA